MTATPLSQTKDLLLAKRGSPYMTSIEGCTIERVDHDDVSDEQILK